MILILMNYFILCMRACMCECICTGKVGKVCKFDIVRAKPTKCAVDIVRAKSANVQSRQIHTYIYKYMYVCMYLSALHIYTYINICMYVQGNHEFVSQNFFSTDGIVVIWTAPCRYRTHRIIIGVLKWLASLLPELRFKCK